MTQGAWAQTTADIGRVIAADGKMYKTVTLANKVSTASGVVAYVGTEVVDRYTDNKYLAISLADIGQGAYGGKGNDFESTSDNLATVLTWINGQSVTTNGHNKIDGAEHPALDKAYNYSTARPSSASIWFVASVGQWNMVVKGLTGINTDLSEDANSDLAYDKVNVKIVAAGATGLISATAYNYVLANPYDKDYVWEYMAEGRVAHWLKDADWYAVRPIFSFLSATNGYVVEYNANGGSGEPAAQSKTHGTALTLSSTVPTRDGYTFAGWATTSDGAVAYAAGGTYSANADVTLYAHWTAIPTHSASFADPSATSDGWSITPASPYEGQTVTVSYSGEHKVKSVTVKANPSTLAGLKAAINDASDLTDLNTKVLGKYVTATGNIQSTSEGAVGIIAYISKTAVDNSFADSRIFVLATENASNSAAQAPSNAAETTYNSTSELNGYAVTNAWQALDGYNASKEGWNYSASRPDGASHWFVPSYGQWMLGGWNDGNNRPCSLMRSTMEGSGQFYAVSTAINTEGNDTGYCVDGSWWGMGSIQRIQGIRVRAAFVY